MTFAAASSLTLSCAIASAALAHIVGDPIPLDLVGSNAPFGDTGAVTYTQLDARGIVAVLASDSAGAAVISITDFDLLGTYTDPGSPGFTDVAISKDGDHVFLASNAADGIHVADISSPTTPTNATTITPAQGTHATPTNITLLADLLYITETTSPVINVFDVSNPAAPLFLRDITTPDTAGIHDVTISNDRLFAAGRGGPLPGDSLGAVYVYDVTDILTAAPILLATIETPEETASASPDPTHTKLFVSQRTLGGAVKLFDITNLQTPIPLSTVTAGDYGINAFSPTKTAVLRQIAFVAWTQAGLEVIDLDQIDAQGLVQPVAFYDTSAESPFNGFTGALSTTPFVSPQLVLVADSTRGLFAVDATPVFPPLVCPGDADDDADVDVFDFAVFAINFGRCDVAPFSRGDTDGDADVDVFDFGIFAANFGCAN